MSALTRQTQQAINFNAARATLRFRNLKWSVELMEITPEIAQGWLLMNTRNRPLGKHAAARMAEQIKKGHWLPNGETIIFDNEEVLLDGQHRLESCIKADTPIIALVVTGVDSRVFPTVDRGCKRTGGHILAIDGHKHYCALAGAANLYWKHINGGVHKSHVHAEGIETKSIIDENPDFHESAEKSRAAKCVVSHSIGTFCHLVFSRQNGPLADNFFESLASGVMLSENDPIFRLRGRLLKIRGDKTTTTDSDHVVALFFKAWNFTKEDAKIKQLSYKPKVEEFPSID